MGFEAANIQSRKENIIFVSDMKLLGFQHELAILSDMSRDFIHEANL